ncbi:hypothetical protein J8J14_13815 [Roseomonas sp. SSH11]|uniref:Uncharacterized protein n=1 Tax=Pararoseomonas baculiformis TaxID=2820812 RepID=A0ABS4AFN8_9PROT|nr:hypothetical protein [Pararoseomonas baculiformis]MBP0445852.1 hypothetical protein [Pararoseomonas baculiformis]
MSSAATAPSFGQISSGHEVLALEKAFDSKDKSAIAEQRWLFRMLRSVNILILAVGLLSGLILAEALVAEHIPAAWRSAVDAATWACGLAITVCGILATVIGQFARGGDQLGLWRTLRSEAELARGQKFATLARLAAASGPGAALEALEAVRVGLLEDQRAYYERRGREHRASAGVTSLWTGVSLALAALASAAAITVLIGVQAQWLLVIGVIGAAIGAYAVDRENLHRDRGNAELYERTALRLNALAGGVDRVAAEVIGGSPQAVVAFTDLVVEELQAEHRQWVEALKVTQEQLDRLDERLREARVRAGRDASARGTVQGGAATGAAPAGEGTSRAATGAGRDSVAELTRWKPLLGAAASILPPPHGERARVLSSELSAVLEPLASGAPVSSGIAAAATLADRLRAENPLGQWLATALPKLAPVVGTVLPPLGVVLGIAAVGARLGEDAYRRWVARVLQAPIAPGVIEPAALTSTMVLAALEISPEFASAWGPERQAGNLDVITEMGRQALADPEGLWSREGDRFNGDRAAFNRGLVALQRVLLARAVEDDTASITRAEMPGGATPATVLDAVSRLQSDPEGRATLQTAVQLVHELRNQGVDDPVAALRMVRPEDGSP